MALSSIAASLLLPGLGDAATFYLSMEGNDNCSGLVDQGRASGSCAWRTLQHAADVVQARDRVMVGNGTYKGFATNSGYGAGGRFAM
jgi:hypothetical protein